VVNTHSDNVSKVTPAGVSSVFATTGAGPSDIAIDPAGNLYTTNIDSNNISKITPAGVSTIFATTGDNPNGIVLDALGNIYTANYSSNNISKITPAGVSTIFATTGDNPNGIVLDALGNIYTANYSSNNISKITPAGVSSVFATTGDGPSDIAIDSAGNIFTSNEGSDNVSKVTPEGASSILAATGSDPYAILLDALGNIFTANSSANNVTKITSVGASSTLGTTGSMPLGLVLDSAGNVYTANSSSNTVTKIAIPLAAPAFTLSQPAETATVGIGIIGYTISSTGGTIASYSISPGISNSPGISFSTATGLISGSPSASTSTVTYTITATNATGSASRTFALTVKPATASVVAIPPSPIPFLLGITAPTIQRSGNFLICTSGTFKAGYEIDGIIQGNSIGLYTPSTYIYNLLINGVPPTTSTVTSTQTNASWAIPAVGAGSILSCSVSVRFDSLNIVTNSTSNISGLIQAQANQRSQIAAADDAYTIALALNERVYQKSLIDNRLVWRKQIQSIRSNYVETLAQINARAITKKTISERSSALKVYIAATKRSAADYRASKPLALLIKQRTDKAALEVKIDAVSQANTSYGLFIQSIGHGVLIP
jgi:streptogramin lyase